MSVERRKRGKNKIDVSLSFFEMREVARYKAFSSERG